MTFSTSSSSSLSSPASACESRSETRSEPPTDGADEAAAQSAEHIRTQFLRRVAHDIASPTGVMMTVLDELGRTASPRPELLAMARRSMRRLMRLSEHLALVAELESGILEPELDTTDVRTLAKQAFDEALAIDGRKDVSAACNLPEASIVIDLDTRLFATVMREIIGNSLKLASSRVEVTLERAGNEIVLVVEDDGPGFSDEAKSSLGRRFIKRSSARGLGLSLSMAREILAAHGGTLALEESKLPPGRRGTPGARLVVRLPSTARKSE